MLQGLADVQLCTDEGSYAALAALVLDASDGAHLVRLVNSVAVALHLVVNLVLLVIFPFPSPWQWPRLRMPMSWPPWNAS